MEQPLCMRREAVCGYNSQIVQENINQDERSADGAAVAIEKHDDGKHTTPDSKQSGTEEASPVRPVNDVFDQRQQKKWKEEQFHVLPDRFVDRSKKRDDRILTRPVIEKMIQRTKDHRDDHIWERLAWNNADHKNLLDM